MLCTFQVFLGAQAGMTLLIFSGWKSRLIRWFAWSVLTGAVGALLCLASQNDGWIPINKNLWWEFTLLTAYKNCMGLINALAIILDWQTKLDYVFKRKSIVVFYRSLSFVLVTTGLAFFLLGACYWLIDVQEWWNGAPFLYPGIFIYLSLKVQRVQD